MIDGLQSLEGKKIHEESPLQHIHTTRQICYSTNKGNNTVINDGGDQKKQICMMSKIMNEIGHYLCELWQIFNPPHST